MPTSTGNWWTRSLSIAAIVVSVATAIASFLSWQSQSEGLEQAKEQFEQSGPSISITKVRVSVWGPPENGAPGAKNKWERQPPGTNIDFEHLRSPYTLYVVRKLYKRGQALKGSPARRWALPDKKGN